MRQKQRKPKNPTPTVIDTTDIEGIDVPMAMLKIYGGLYAGVMHIQGVDADGMHTDDKERLYNAWANAEMTCDLQRKIVMCDAVPVMEDQRNHILMRMESAPNEYCRQLLERELLWVEALEKTQRDRIGYVLFYGSDQDQIYASMELYKSKLSQAQVRADILKGEKMASKEESIAAMVEIIQLVKALYRPTT